MIRTNYTDRQVINRHLDALDDVTDVLKNMAIAVAATLDDLGITITDTREEFWEVLAKIPEGQPFRVVEGKGRRVFMHARIDGLPETP